MENKIGIVRFDFDFHTKFAAEIGIYPSEIEAWVQARFEDVIAYVAAIKPGDIAIVSSGMAHTLTVGGIEYPLEFVQKIGLECPCCSAILVPPPSPEPTEQPGETGSADPTGTPDPSD